MVDSKLEEIVAEMKSKALMNKLDVANNTAPPYKECTKTIAVGDNLFKVMFTCDVLPWENQGERKEIWHLSMSTIPYGPVLNETADKLRKAFFGEAESFEVPSVLHGDRVRQYIAKK